MLTSIENPFIKMVLSLGKKKNRTKKKLFLAEGPHLVQEALSAGFGLKGVIVTSPSLNEELDSLINKVKDMRIRIYEVTPNLFERLAETETPQGIIALAKLPDQVEEWPNPNQYLGFVLDGIQDPGNVGTIIRTAWGAGTKDIFISDGTADPYSGKAVRASQGGIFHLQVHIKPVEEVIRWANLHNVTLWIGDPKADRIYFSQDLTVPSLFVLGAEAHGPSPELIKAGIPVKIPLSSGMDSLNVSISSGVLVFEALRQRWISSF